MTKPPVSPFRQFWREWVVGALLPVWLLVTFVGTVARVNGESMHPTLQQGDVLILAKWPRWARAWGIGGAYPRRGQLVIFKAPAGDPYSYEKRYGVTYRPYNIKRVVGLPGDQLEIRDSVLYVNGKAQAERYASDGVLSDQAVLKVPAGKIWVLGDNRLAGASLDSRAYGPVSLADTAGPVVWRVWPKWGRLP